jgi:hypothetical protein
VEDAIKASLESGIAVLLQVDSEHLPVGLLLRLLDLASGLIASDKLSGTNSLDPPLLPVGDTCVTLLEPL